ncbi:MAG TPA: long-chain fatty acid--CoA ligase [Acidimicrobiia bacterium]|nr:long-chain fatty acid--CoA ligase [Acidimicrobiia bacterium]
MNLGEILAASARAYPDRVALVWHDGAERRTYREVDDRASALAAGLVEDLKVQPGDRVAVMMSNSPELLETLFAVWKSGATIAPLNARLTREEILYQVTDCGARVFIVGDEFTDVALGLRDELEVDSFVLARPAPTGDGAGTTLLDDLRDRHAGEQPPDPGTTDTDVAWLAYTSGTTGRPKGAMLSHGCLTYVAVTWLADLQRLEPEDVGLVAAPLTHGAGIMALAFVMKGAAQVLLHGFDPAKFMATVAEEKVSHTWLVPTQVRILLDSPAMETADLSTLKTIVYGGAPMYMEDLKEAMARIGPIFVQLFAQTESPMTGTYMRAEEHILEGPGSERLASCGHARSGMEVAILDDDDRRVPAGETGEICIKGPALMNGYWNRPEATAETLRGGWLHTGDIGRMDDHGYVFILDRTKDMVISGGLNVYPREIEEVLLRHPAISQAAVIGVPDPKWGEAVKAVVVADGPGQLTEAEVIAFAAEHLAGYKKPKSVEFVADLPKTTYGKIDKKAIRAPYWAGRDRMV